MVERRGHFLLHKHLGHRVATAARLVEDAGEVWQPAERQAQAGRVQGASARGRAVQLQVRGEARRGRLRLDVGTTLVVVLGRRPLLLAQAHPQVATVGEVQVHVEGVRGSVAVVVGEEAVMIHDGAAVSL